MFETIGMHENALGRSCHEDNYFILLYFQDYFSFLYVVGSLRHLAFGTQKYLETFGLAIETSTDFSGQILL